MTRFFSVSCDKCGDAYETSKRTLPFVCSECENAMEFWKKIDQSPSETIADTCPEYCDCVPDATETEGDPCDTGSVEATTDLIAALEDDNAKAQKQIAYLEAREQALTATVNSRDHAIETMAVKIGHLIDRKDDAVAELKTLADAAAKFVNASLEQVLCDADKIAELTEKLSQADAALEEKDVEIASARDVISDLSTRLDGSRKTRERLYDAICRAEERGLLSRIFNAPIL